MEKKDVTMMLIFGLGRLVDGTRDASSCNDDCCDDAAAGEDVLTLPPDVSSPPAAVAPSRYDS